MFSRRDFHIKMDVVKKGVNQLDSSGMGVDPIVGDGNQ